MIRSQEGREFVAPGVGREQSNPRRLSDLLPLVLARYGTAGECEAVGRRSSNLARPQDNDVAGVHNYESAHGESTQGEAVCWS